MGKHEAPSPAKKRSTGSARHADPASAQGGFRLNTQDWKLPDFSKLSAKLKGASDRQDRDGTEDQETEVEEDEDIKIFSGKKTASEQKPVEEAEEVDDEDLEEEEEEDDLPPSGRHIGLPKPGKEKLNAFFKRLTELGASGATAISSHKRSIAFGRNEVLLTAGSVLLFFILWMLPTRGALRFVLYLIPSFVLGFYPLLDAVNEVMDRVIPGRSTLICVAAIGLICLGDPQSAFFALLVFWLLQLIEAYLFEKKASALEAIDAKIPSSAVIETEAGLEKTDPKTVKAGDILFIPAGEIIALDGVVTDGISTLDASALCGSGSNIDVGLNSPVYAGCRNLTNPLRIRVTAEYSDTALYRCVQRVKTAAQSEPGRAPLLQRILSYLPLGLSVLGLALGLIVSIVTGAWRIWIGRGLLLIALGACGDLLLSARMAYFTGIIDNFREGISFLDADTVDRFSGSDMMIFSKTGSITEGKYSVVAVYPVDYEEKDLLTIAALAECQSTHPIASALREACGIEMHHRDDITLLEETPGRGIHTLFGGRNVYVGNSTLLLDHNIVFDVPSHKGTVIHVAVDNKYAGCIVLNDRVRDTAYDAMEELRLRGIRATVMLTGDVRSMARPIASSLGFDMVKCELSNESKLEALNYLRDSKGNSAAISYVSSKDEDLELLQAADVGVGFAGLSQPGLIGSASVLILGSKFYQIPQAMFLAKRTSFAAMLSALIMLALELLLIILGLAGIVSVWSALLFVLVARAATLIYTIYFK